MNVEFIEETTITVMPVEPRPTLRQRVFALDTSQCQPFHKTAPLATDARLCDLLARAVEREIAANV